MISHALGAKNSVLACDYLKRGKMIVLYGMIPVSLITYYSDELLISIGQNPDVSRKAGQYCLACLPGLLMSGLNDLQSCYLNTLNFSHFPMICLMVSLILHLALCNIMVNQDHLGIVGVGLSMSISNCMSYLLMFFYIKVLEMTENPNKKR